MISLLLSSASRKAWVSGLVAALLTPVYELLNSGGEITSRTLAASVIGGLLGLAATFAVTNTPPGPVTEEDLDEPGAHAPDRENHDPNDYIGADDDGRPGAIGLG